MDKKLSRRSILLRGLQLPIGGSLILGLSACGNEGSSDSRALLCADPDAMSSAEASLRRTLKYTETSPDASKVCAGCEFFSASTAGSGCGNCGMFDGKPVSPGGHCDSWSVDKA